MIYNKYKKYCFFLLPNAHIQDYDSSSNNTYMYNYRFKYHCKCTYMYILKVIG